MPDFADAPWGAAEAPAAAARVCEALDLVRQVRLHCGKAALLGMAHVDLEADFAGHDVAREDQRLRSFHRP